ncbi:MAG: hypothetical protein ACRDB0_01320 [Paraclostridium sp.]
MPLNGEEVLLPSHVIKARPKINSYVENGHLYVNGYKYDNETKTWKKTLYAKWLLIDIYTQVQLIASSAFALFVIMLIIICQVKLNS